MSESECNPLSKCEFHRSLKVSNNHAICSTLSASEDWFIIHLVALIAFAPPYPVLFVAAGDKSVMIQLLDKVNKT